MLLTVTESFSELNGHKNISETHYSHVFIAVLVANVGSVTGFRSQSCPCGQRFTKVGSVDDEFYQQEAGQTSQLVLWHSWGYETFCVCSTTHAHSNAARFVSVATMVCELEPLRNRRGARAVIGKSTLKSPANQVVMRRSKQEQWCLGLEELKGF